MPGIKIPMPAIMGLDLAGEIAELGPGVEGWRVGDRVLVDPDRPRARAGSMGETIHGGLAERCRVGAHQLIRIPAGVSFADAAALPVAYGTAHRMMVTQRTHHRRRARPHPRRQRRRRHLLRVPGQDGRAPPSIACGSSDESRSSACTGSAPTTSSTTRAATSWPRSTARFGKPTRRNFEGGVDVVDQLHRRRHLGAVAPLPAPRRTPAHLRGHRRLRSEGRTSATSGPSSSRSSAPTAGRRTTSRRCCAWSTSAGCARDRPGAAAHRGARGHPPARRPLR